MFTKEMREKLQEICAGTGSRVAFDEDLFAHSTIAIGGKAAAWVMPVSLEGLRRVKLFLRDQGMPFFIIGNGSNVLIPDNGLEAVVINLNNGFFVRKEFEGRKVLAGCGVKLGDLISDCCLKGLSGLEGLAGIPATVGGALKTNASYHVAVSDCLESVRMLDEQGEVKWIKKESLRFGYRSSSFNKGQIILEAVFFLEKKLPEDLKRKLGINFSEKMERQPLDKKTLGCIFKNPPEGEYKSGQLIDMAGMKGACSGDAQVSEKHANFIINNGNATARDVMVLINDIRQKVREKFSIELETEIEIL
jgi:UDP-N-acetylmuramate dehydrogenase